MSPAAALRRRIAEANPVLIKDLRQFLRGRLFRGAFVLTLIVATVVATIMVSAINQWNRNQSGIDLFFGLGIAYALAVFLVGPVLANRGMAAEREQHLLDALALTGLSPARIVAGKFASAAALTLLIFSAFLPGFAASFALFGLDYAVAAGILILTTVAGIGLNAVGIWAACVARSGMAGNLMLGLLLIFLGGACAAWLGSMFAFSFAMSWGGRASPAWILVAMLLAGLLIAGVARWMLALSAWLLAHESQPAVGRVRAAAAVLVGLAGLTAVVALTSAPRPGAVNLAGSLLFALITALMLPNLCERDALGRRAAFELQHGRRRGSLLRMPGGGGATLIWLGLLAVSSLVFLFPVAMSGRGDDIPRAPLPFAMLALCVATGTWLPVFAGRAGSTRPRWVLLSYAALPILAIAHLILAGMLGAMDSEPFGSLNPVVLLVMAGGGDQDYQFGLLVWSVVAASGLVFGVGRIARAGQQIARARSAGAPPA